MGECVNITEVTRRDIIDYLISREKPFSGRLGEVEFLERIWDLASMPSTDRRFSDAHGDIWQHRINNSDWDDHHLLCTYLELLKCEDETFTKFLENCIHPFVVPDKEELNDLLTIFNEALKRDGFVLREASRLSGKAVYKAMKLKSGVRGSVKNLIFAANGPKPEIVLIDSVNNDIQIVQNEQYCLVYDKPILERGLLWADLIEWWIELRHITSQPRETQEKQLYWRLLASLASPPERLLYRTYYQHFLPTLGVAVPALVPQVYLHYDPKTINQLPKGKRLVRQRMDFLLLFSNHERIVLEVDGQQHYSVNNKANPGLYGEMVAEDRRLRLAGYEMYRFGGYELREEDKGKAVTTLIEFFEALFNFHSVKR